MSKAGVRGSVTAAGLLLAGLVVLAADGALAQGCSMCATYLNEADPAARGMKFSILFLMAMPFTMLVTVGGWFYYVYRGSRRRPVLQFWSTRREEEL